MKINKFNFILAITAIILVTTSCKKDDDGPSLKPVRYVTEKDTFKTDVIWYPDTIYVIKSEPNFKSKLTIRPGTLIKLESGSSLIVSDIMAVGTAEEPIIFTSLYDDKYGGDIDGDNGVIEPKSGDWIYIGNISPNLVLQFNALAKKDKPFIDLKEASSTVENMEFRIKYCKFLYGGSVGAFGMTDLEIENCEFAHCGGMIPVMYDIALYCIVGLPGNVVVSKNLFYDNGIPICTYPCFSVDSSNTFSYEGIGNKKNGIYIYPKEMKLSFSVDWLETEVPYVLQENLNIKDGGHLGFSDGVVIKCFKDVAIAIEAGGSLNSNSYDVIFTSYKDDDHGGDTNGDGNATTPQDGDWKGICNTNIINGWWNGSNVLYDENHSIIIIH